MHIFIMINALIYINNYVITFINSMLSVAPESRTQVVSETNGELRAVCPQYYKSEEEEENAPKKEVEGEVCIAVVADS